MIVAEDKKIKKCPVSLQPDIENLLQDLSPDDFASASRQEKDDFIQDRQSVSYWKDAWRRLKKNVVAMVALGVIVFLFLFAFVGPLLIPYGYDEFNKGAENLYPYHYTLEDTQRVNDEIASRTQSDVVDVDEMIAQAKAEAEKKGEKFTKKDEAVIRAKAKVAAKPSEDSSEEQSVDEDSVRKELGIKKHIFGYSQAELERKANGEKVFPHVFGTDMYGRDILVRVMYGARVSMSVGVFAAILVLVIGALYGAISGYCGGKVDAVMQRIVELIYAVPEMLVVLLIADEPTTALDVTIQAQILDLMKDLQKKTGMGIIFITHNLGVVADICDKVSVMYAGKIVEQGPVDDIFYEPAHPYTKGLLRSMPRVDAESYERLIPIEGTPVDMLNPPEGCPFAPRCEHCMKICLKKMPPYVEVGEKHRSACWLRVQELMNKEEK